MRISDWSSDVCSSDLAAVELLLGACALRHDLSFNLLWSHVRSFLAEEQGLSLDPHRRALRPVRPPLHQACGANCEAALMARIAGPVKFSRGHPRNRCPTSNRIG